MAGGRELLIFAAVFLLLLYVLYRYRSSQIPFHRICLAIIIIGVCCRLLFLFFTPTYYAPDEQAHFNYVKYLYENRSFPIQTTQTGAPTNDWEYYQPPLYYLASAPIYAMVRNSYGGDHYASVRVIRLFSILLWGINVLLALKILENLRLTSTFIKTFVVSMVSFLPTYAYLSSVINNDNLLITLGGVILYLLSRKRSISNSVVLGVVLGLALLTKLTAVVFLLTIVAMLFFQWIRRSLSFSSAGFHLVLILVLASAVASPWYVRNVIVYGDITAEKIANIRVHWPSTSYALQFIQQYMKESFWSVAGIRNNIRFLPRAGIYLSYLALAGLLYGLVLRRREMRDFLEGEGAAFLIAMALAIVVNIALVFRFGMLYAQGQGRFLFPMLVPISLLMAIGIRMLGITRLSRNAHLFPTAFFLAYLLSFISHSFKIFVQLW